MRVSSSPYSAGLSLNDFISSSSALNFMCADFTIAKFSAALLLSLQFADFARPFKSAARRRFIIIFLTTQRNSGAPLCVSVK